MSDQKAYEQYCSHYLDKIKGAGKIDHLLVPNFLSDDDLEKIGVLDLLLRSKSECKQVIFQEFSSVFLNRVNDSKRLMKVPEDNDKILDIMKNKISFVENVLDTKLSPPGLSRLLSLEGCMRQAFHTDFPRDSDMSRHSYGAIVALMDDTFVYGCDEVYDSVNSKVVLFPKKFLLKKGDMFIFRGDYVHAGAEYSKDNVRLHFYVEPKKRGMYPGEIRSIGKTYGVDLEEHANKFSGEIEHSKTQSSNENATRALFKRMVKKKTRDLNLKKGCGKSATRYKK